MKIGAKVNHVLITRPLEGALATGMELSNKGFKVSVLPLTIITPLLVCNRQKNPQNIIVSSAASFYYLPKHYLPLFQTANLYCIGEQTAQAAYKYGLRQKCIIYRDAKSLVKNKPELKNLTLYICGRRRTNNIELYLKDKNHDILESYETLPHNKNLVFIKQNKLEIDIALLTSVYTAMLFKEINVFLPNNIKLVCFSKRIAEALEGFNNIYVTDDPNEKSAINLIESL